MGNREKVVLIEIPTDCQVFSKVKSIEIENFLLTCQPKVSSVVAICFTELTTGQPDFEQPHWHVIDKTVRDTVALQSKNGLEK